MYFIASKPACHSTYPDATVRDLESVIKDRVNQLTDIAMIVRQK